MKRVLAAVFLAIALTSLMGASATAGDQAGDAYRAYAKVRSQMQSCSLDRTWRHLGAEARKRCTRLRKLYTLWSSPGESGRYHVHCRRPRPCPPQPIGEPDPRAPIPDGARVFR